jgi:general secretion pathway protein K
MNRAVSILRDKRGVVLLLVLATIALFTVMVVNFSADEGLDMQLAYNFRDSMQAQYIARSGVEAAIALLKKDDLAYDSEDEDWGSFNEYAMGASQYLGSQTITGTVTDESGRFDLNSMAKAEGQTYRINQFKKIFELLEIDISPTELTDLGNAVRDWIDKDDDDGGNGAEEKYYQSLETPYHCKNAPFDSPEEILLVKGMKPEYYYGTETYKGIKDYVAVGTGGTVNINTASDIVIRSIAGALDNDGVMKIIKDGRPWKTRQSNWATVLGIAPGDADLQWINKVLTNTTEVFRADMKGTLPTGAQMNIMALLQRVQNDVKIVYYKIY